MNIKKFISIITCFCFLFSVFTQNIFANINYDVNIGDKYLSKDLFSNNYGKITDVNLKQNNNFSVINIQDLHSNYYAQTNIKNILNSLQKNFNIKKIFVEGGYGKIDTSWLNKIKDEKYRNKIIKQLVLNGRLTGTELFAYESKTNNILFGLESKEIHKQNLNRLSQIFDKQVYFDSQLVKIKSDIDFLSSKYFSKDNLYLNRLIDNYNNNKIDSKEFYTKLKKLAEKINKNPNKYNNFVSINFYDFDNINKYILISSQKINNKKVINDLKYFIHILKEKLSYSEYNDLISDTNNLTDINKLCNYIEDFSVKNNIDLTYNYSNLQQYIKSNKLLSSINPLKLIYEERMLLNNLRQAFSNNSTEYEISFLTDFYYTFKDYLTNKITSTNYAYFKENFENFKTLYSKYSVVNRLSFLEKDFTLLNEYYSTNDLRNEIFLEKILSNIDISKLNKGEVIVVVSGGYHTVGLSELLQKRNVGYMTITPNIEENKQAYDNYKNIIKEQVAVNNNALSFALASSTTNVEQFNDLVISAIQLSGGFYSKEILEDIIEQLKPLVNADVILNYSNKQSIIAVGNRNIVLNNVNGKIQYEKTDTLTTDAVRLKTSFINELFEKNSGLNFSEGIIFELRNADKILTEINGIDLAVIARFPEIIQKYFYNQLSNAQKEQLKQLDDKTPFTMDTKLLSKIKSIKNIKVRNSLYKIYSVLLSPLIELSWFNKIFYTQSDKQKTDLKNKFLNKHEEYRKGNEQVKKQYETNLEFLLNSISSSYNKIYEKTHCKIIANLSLMILNIKYHRDWNRENVLKNTKNNTKKFIVRIVIGILLIATISVSTFTKFANNYENNIPVLYSDYVESYSSHLKFFDNVFDVDYGNMSETEMYQTKQLEDFVENVINKNGETNYYKSLLEIRERITDPNSKLMPTISDEDYEYMEIWKALVTYIDKSVAYNIGNIEEQLGKDLLLSAYSEDETEYLKIYGTTDKKELYEIINSDKDYMYRFYAYMVFKANGYQEKEGEFDTLLNKDNIYNYWQQKYVFMNEQESNFNFYNIENSFQWQTLCGMSNFILDAKQDYGYILANGRIVEEEEDSDGINAMAKSNLLYSHIKDPVLSNANSSPILVAVHEMAHRQQVNTFGYNKNTMELYAYTVESIIAKELNIDFTYNLTTESLLGINEDIEVHDLGRVIIEVTKRVIGIDNLELLQDSIIEYVNKNGNTNDYKRNMADDIVTILINKYIDQQIQEGTIEEKNREDVFISLYKQFYNFDNFFSKYISSSNIPEDLDHFLKSSLEEVNNYSEFYNALLNIRKELVDLESDYVADIADMGVGYVDSSNMTEEEQFRHEKRFTSQKQKATTINVNVWKRIINMIDDKLALDMNFIENDSQLYDKLISVYGENNVEYLKVRSFKNNQDELINIVKSNRDIKYRFYAYMFLNNNSRKEIDDSDFKQDITDFLMDYDISSIDFTQPNNLYEWSNLCGMVGYVVYEENFYNYFDNIIDNSAIVKNDASGEDFVTDRQYVYTIVSNKLKDVTSNPILIAAYSNSITFYKNINNIVNEEDLKDELMDLYLDVSLLNVAQNLSINYSLKEKYISSINEINDSTDNIKIAKWLVSKLNSYTDEDSRYLLQESIISYLRKCDSNSVVATSILNEIKAKSRNNIEATTVVSKEEFIETVSKLIDNYKNNPIITKSSPRGLDEEEKKSIKISNQYLENVTHEQIESILDDFLKFINEDVENYTFDDSSTFEKMFRYMVDDYSKQKTHSVDNVKGILTEYVSNIVEQRIEKGYISENDREIEISNIIKQILDDKGLAEPKIIFQDGKKYILTLDTPLVQKIKNIKNIKLRRKMLKVYSVFIAPIVELPIINKLFYLKMMSIDDAQYEKEKESFLEGHKEYGKATQEGKIEFEKELDSIIKVMSERYKAVYSKTKIKQLSAFSAKLIGLKKHKQINKEYFIPKQQKQNLTIGQKIKKHIKRFFIAVAVVLGLALGALIIISPTDFTAMVSSTGYAISKIDFSSQQDYYMGLIDTKIEWSNSYMPTMDSSYYKYVWKYQLYQMENQIADGMDIILEDSKLTSKLNEAYTEDEIGYLKILAQRNNNDSLKEIINNKDENRFYRFYAHMLLNANGYKDKENEFSDLFNKEETFKWINQTDKLENEVTDFEWQVKCYVAEHVLGYKITSNYIKRFARVIKTGESHPTFVAMSDLSYGDINLTYEVWATAAHEDGHNDMYDKLFMLNSLAPMSINELYAYSSERAFALMVGIPDGIYSRGSLISVNNTTEEHDAGRAVITTVRENLGDDYYDLIRESIVEYYYTVPLESSVRQQTIDILKIFADKVISKKIEDGEIKEEDRQKSYDALLKNLINYTGYFTKYLNTDSQNIQTKMLSEYIVNKSNDISDEKEFFRTLLEIRKEMLSQESNFIPTIENKSYLATWTLVLNKIDETVISNLDQIKSDKEISALFNEVYTEDEIEYLKIYVLQFSQSTDDLVNVVKSNKDFKYRFYAYMLLGNIENTADLISKEEVINYLLNDYDYSNIDFSKINSTYEWKTLCGMTSFIMNDNYNSQFPTILNTAMIIGDSGSISDEYLSGAELTAEEKREMRLDKEGYLNSLSAKENYTYNSIKEMYSEITDNPILLSVASNSLAGYKKYNFSEGVADIKNELKDLYVYVNMFVVADKLSINLPINTEYLENIYGINEDTNWLSIAKLMFEKSRECNDIDLFVSIIPKYIENLDAQDTIEENILRSVYFNMLTKDVTSKEEILEILKQSMDEYIANGRLTTTNTRGMDATDKAETKITNNYILKSDQLVDKETLLTDFFNFVSSNMDNMDSKYIIDGKIEYKKYIYAMISDYLKQDKTRQTKISEIFDVYIKELVSQEIEQGIISETDKDLQIQEYKTICTSNVVYNKNQTINNENIPVSNILNVIYVLSGIALLVGFISLLKGKLFLNNSYFGIYNKKQIVQIFEEIPVEKIDLYTNGKQLQTDLLCEKVFIINGNINEDIKAKINLRPLGVKVSGEQIYVSDNTSSIFIYADNSNFDDIVNTLKNNSSLSKKVISNINLDVDLNDVNIIPVKISNNLNKNSIEISDDLITVSNQYDNIDLIEVLSSYVDVMTRQGFVVKENLFRYVDDINMNLSKEERKQAFIDILQEQMTTQLIIDYNIFTQLQQDFGYEIFKDLINQLKEKNIRLYVGISTENSVKDLANNEFISGYIMFDKTDFENVNNGVESRNIVCTIFDNLTFDSFEASFIAQSNSNTCNKIMDAINSNVFKQPLIFRDSSIKQAVNNQRDTTVYNNLKSVFSIGKLTNILSNLKSNYNSKKFISTYKISELAESFDKDDINLLLSLYEKHFNKNKKMSVESYREFIDILSKCENLKKFFNVSEISKISNLDLFIENIIFRIKAADILKDQGKEIGLKNIKYEDILSKALKIKFINNIEDGQIDNEVLKLSQIQDQLTKEQILKKYIEDNITNLTQRAFNNEKPDSIAINTIIFLMPYAEVADIEIDVNDMLDKQYDLRLTKSILSAA